MSACVRGGRALVGRAGTRAEEIPNRMRPPYFPARPGEPAFNNAQSTDFAYTVGWGDGAQKVAFHLHQTVFAYTVGAVITAGESK